MGKTAASSILAILLVPIGFAAQNSLPPPGAEADSRLAVTEHFEFHSSFWANLHDRLYEIGQPDASAPELCALDVEERRGWEEAVARYRSDVAARHHRTDPLMRALRVALGGFGPVPPEGDVARHLELLRAAAPAWRTCFWSDQQRRNRAWLDDLAPRLEEYEQRLAELLSGFFRQGWPGSPIRVDIVAYASWAGANTIVEPNHMQISSVNPGYREWSGLEMLFHEASHVMVDGSSTPIGRQIQAASRNRDAEAPPNLWHALLFYTVGKTVQSALQAEGHSGYEPYVYRQGLFRRAWGAYQKPLEQHWQPYLDGELDLETAVDRLVAASLANLEAGRSDPWELHGLPGDAG